MNKIRLDADKSPVSHILIVLFFSVGFISIPLDKLFNLSISNSEYSFLISQSVLRLSLSIGLFFAIKKYSFNIFKSVNVKNYLLILILALIVAVFNFPFIGVLNSNVVITRNLTLIALYVIYCLSVGVMEELCFRGVILPLCVIIFKNKKHNAILVIFTSSAIFGATHLLNLLGGASFGGVILQVGYSFLIGAMCGIVLLFSKSIFYPILLHFIFDIGGLLTSANLSVAFGNQWDTLTIILTAVIGSIVAIVFILKTVFCDDEKIKRIID